jgi:hypothetical protein
MYGGVTPDDLFDEWTEQLAGFGGLDLRLALDAARMAYKEFPPTLPQFVDLCKEARQRRARSAPALLSPRSRDAIPAEIVAMLHDFGKVNRKRDPRDWARRIVVEADAGTYTFPLGIQMAREALGMA